MAAFRYLLLLSLLCSTEVYAAYCSDIWTQAIRPSSSVPATIPVPGTPNPTFPEPLQPIDYYYADSGNYFIGNNGTRSTTGATTRLFINGNLTLDNNVQLNAGGPPQNLIIVVTGNLILNNNVYINGFVLVGGTVQLYNNAIINGALTAKGTVNNFAGTVNYRPEAIPLLVGGVVCDASPQASILRAHYPLDLCTAASSSVIEDLTGKYPASGINVSPLAAGQVAEAADFSATPNDYINVPPATLNGLTDFSLALWFKLDAISSVRELFSASSATVDNELELYVTSSNELRAGFKGSYYTFSGGSVSPVVNNNTWYQVVLQRSGSQLCLYLDNTLVNCVSASSANLSVARAAIGVWWKANGTFADDFRGDIDEVLIFNQPRTLAQIQQMYSNQKAGRSYDGATRTSKCTQCLADSFSSAGLSASWITSRSSGSFSPQIVNGRLRMSDTSTNQAVSATFQRMYPATDNLLTIEFDYWAYGGSGADGLALVLSDANITPRAGSFGGALGYGHKSGIAGFAGGWLGIGLDEYGNFSNEGGGGSIGRRAQSVVVRGSGSGTSGYNYLRGSCNNGTTNTSSNCLTPTIDGNASAAHRYRFTIDSRTPGSTLVSVERNTGSGFVTLIAPFNAQNQPGQAGIPENFLVSLTSATSSATNIHELDNLSICALRALPVAEQIDHFEFDYSGQALTCKPETFNVRACKNASCTELYTGNVNLTLSPASTSDVNWLGGNNISFSNGQGVATLRRTVAGVTTVGVSASAPASKPLTQTLCRAGSGALSASACSVSFADSGLLFDVPDGIANQPQQNIVLSAVRTDNVSQQCVPEFANVSRSIAFWSDYITPTAVGRVASEPITVNQQNVALTQAQATTQTLSFNAQGQAAITVNYGDAGRMQLNARYTGSAATSDSGLLMHGADQFVRRPAGLCIQTGGECTSADSSCSKFAVAGAPFMLKITAHRFQSNSSQLCSNPVTPSFSYNGIALSHSLIAPATGSSGTLSSSSYNHQPAITSENTVSQSVSEVGVFRFHTAAVNYLGMADPLPAASSDATGRFVPASFSLTAGLPVAACGPFSYFGQPSFSTAFTLQALNALGQRTQNYHADFARLQLQPWTDSSASTGLRFSAPDLPAGSVLTQGALAPLGNWQQGEAQLIASHIASRPTLPVPPLALTVYAAPVDSDMVSGTGAVNSQTTELRYGRLVLDNAAGPEEAPLPLAFSSEYWQGERFVRNLADNCTTIDADAARLNTRQGTPALLLAGSDSTLVQGRLPAQQIWLAPTNQTGNWQIEYRADPWLQYYWRGAVADYQQNPQADIMFGRFRGNPRQISWRELFQ